MLTVLILSLFYIFATASEFTSPLIDFGTFALIFLFGIIISVANIILAYDRLRLIIRIAIHYASLLVAFSVVFIISGKLGNGNMGAVTAAIIVFTFLYAIIFPIAYFAIKGIRAADRKVDKHISEKHKTDPKKEKKSDYKPLYK